MYKIAKLALFSALFLLCSCDFIGDKTPSLDKAEAQFIAEAQIMSEQDALSKEISWYKAPQITERTLSRKLTGSFRDNIGVSVIIHRVSVFIYEKSGKK